MIAKAHKNAPQEVPGRTHCSLEEFAYRYGISMPSVSRHVKAGRIRTIKIGARRLIPPQEVLRIEAEGIPLPPRKSSQRVKAEK
jgi:hypothetical protein